MAGALLTLAGCGAAVARADGQADTPRAGTGPNGLPVDTRVDPAGAQRRILAQPRGDGGLEWIFNIVGMPAAERETFNVRWDFGDGATAEGDIVTHRFAAPGAYLTSVTATGPRGLSAYTLATITSVSADAGEATAHLLVAMEGRINHEGDRPVLFATAHTSALLPNETVRYLWEFADGSRADASAVTHVIRRPGPYRVSVSAETSRGRRAEYFKYFTAFHAVPGEEGSTPSLTDPTQTGVIADAGPDQEVPIGVVVMLDGSGSRSDSGGPAAFSWTQTSGPAVVIRSADAPVAWFPVPVPSGDSIALGFQLTLTQGQNRDTDQVQVVVRKNLGDPAPATDAQLLTWLRELDPLPKVHYSWPISVEMFGGFSGTIDPLAVEYIRITHAVSISSGAHRAHRINRIVALCHALNTGGAAIPASIAIIHSPWHHVFPPEAPPTDFGPDHHAEIQLFRDRLTILRDQVNNANAAQGADVRVSALKLDSERFRTKSATEAGYQEWNAAMTAKYNAFYLVGKELFPGATVDWFQRGQPRKNWFTLEEMGDSFSCSLYNLPDQRDMRDRYRGTYYTAQQHGVDNLNVWVGLACGWRNGRAPFLFDWDYSVGYTWQLGAEINNPWFGNRPDHFAPWGPVRFAVFYPVPFDERTPHWGKHFVAYVRGAHGLPWPVPNTRR